MTLQLGRRGGGRTSRTACDRGAGVTVGSLPGSADHDRHEFAEVRVLRVETRNGSRLLMESPKSAQWVALCPLELESLTWQNTATFSAMVNNPLGPLAQEDEERS